LTPVELVVLGLVAERPRHGYDVEAAIAARRLREWTPVGFSSIYHVLNKLAAAGLAAGRVQPGKGVPPRVFRLSAAGRSALRHELRRILSAPSRSGHEVELAMMFAPQLGRAGLVKCLKQRAEQAAANLREERKLRRLYQRRAGRLWTDLIFRHTVRYLSAELAWTREVLAVLKRDQGGRK